MLRYKMGAKHCTLNKRQILFFNRDLLLNRAIFPHSEISKCTIILVKMEAFMIQILVSHDIASFSLAEHLCHQIVNISGSSPKPFLLPLTITTLSFLLCETGSGII